MSKNKVDIRLQYRQDTGHSHTGEGVSNKNGSLNEDSFYPNYVLWLEEQLIKANQYFAWVDDGVNYDNW